MRVAIYYRDLGELSRMVELLGLLSGCKNPIYWDERFPPCSLSLKKTDWQIVSSLRRDPKRSLGDIARDVGVSTRTVRRRLTGMIEGSAITLLPLGDVKRSAGLTSQFFLRLESSKKRKIDEMMRAKLDSLVFANTWSGPYSGYAVFCSNIADAEATRDWLSGQDGVTGVEMHLMKEIIHVKGWLDEEIERHT